MVGVTEVSVVIAAALATFFSPCAYALLPGYVGYTAHRTDSGGAGIGMVRGLLAGSGILLSLGALTGLFVLVGGRLTDGIQYVEPAVGVVIALFGVMLVMGWAPTIHVALPARPSSSIGFGLFGAGYGVAAVGCSLPVFVGVVGTASTVDPGTGAVLVSLYVGIVVVLMVAVTVAAAVGAGAVLSRFAAHTGRISTLAGVILILAGLGQVWIALTVSPVGT